MAEERVTIRKASRSGRIVEKDVSLTTWDLMRTQMDKGSVRKGWELVKGGGGNGQASKPKPAGKSPAATFMPEEIGGPVAPAAAVAEAPVDPVAVNTPEAPTASPVPPAAEPAPEPVVESTPPAPDNLMTLQNMSPKVVEMLHGMGITTFAQLASADPAGIKQGIEDIKLAPKAALIPGWQSKAKELSKA